MVIASAGYIACQGHDFYLAQRLVLLQAIFLGEESLLVRGDFDLVKLPQLVPDLHN